MNKFIFICIVLLSIVVVGCSTTPTDVGSRIAKKKQTEISNMTTIPAIRIGGKSSVVLNGRRTNINILKAGSEYKTPEIRSRTTGGS